MKTPQLAVVLVSMMKEKTSARFLKDPFKHACGLLEKNHFGSVRFTELEIEDHIS